MALRITKEYNFRPIAIHLPQFHPIPENDTWWGKGFTEWTNVVKAKPLFEGHYQPHLPADLGFYDLRLEESRIAQADLARQAGIFGFCYYHYWFNGKRILERPVDEILNTGKPDFPFMLCWANENWTRRWDGNDEHILLKQHYSEEDDRIHIRTLIPYFKDARYIKIEGKPVFAVYKSGILPNVRRTLQIWREEAEKVGIELYLTRFENFGEYGKTYIELGFDAGIEFQPFSKLFDDYLKEKENKEWVHSWKYKFQRHYYKFTNQEEKSKQAYLNCIRHLDYNDYVNHIFKSYSFEKDYVKFPGIAPSWDNTARRGENALYLKNASPQKFREWLNFILKNFVPPSKEENFIFINAWNEWAEGNHLEPCQKWGRAYLDAVKEEMDNYHGKPDHIG